MLFSATENANTAHGERSMVDLEMDDGLAVITIDRPHARNAISLETMDQFDKALDGADGRGRARHHGRRRPGVRLGRRPQGTQRAAHRTGSRGDGVADAVDLRPHRRLSRPDHRRAERARARRRRRGGGGRRHPAGRRRHQDRLQPGGAGDHARVGRRRAARRAGRLQQGAAAGGHRHRCSTAAEAERIGLVDQVLPARVLRRRLARDRASCWRTVRPARSSA